MLIAVGVNRNNVNAVDSTDQLGMRSNPATI